MANLFMRPSVRTGRTDPTHRHSRLGGAFLGPVPGSLDRATAMERWLDAPLHCQTVFEPWDTRSAAISDLFDRLTTVWNADRIPLVTWEAFTPTPAATPADVLTRGANGEYDDYFAEWASALAEWVAGPDKRFGTDDDRQLYLRPLHEPNGDWYPWAPAGADCEPSTYVQVWRRLHRIVRSASVGSDHVRWLWAVNHVDVGGCRAESLFPGDAVVDVVGVDGFNWGASRPSSSWHTPKAVFESMFDRVTALSSRPLAVPEFGCSSVTADGYDRSRKNAWLAEAFAYFQDRDVKLAAYFDVEKETDWQVFGGSRGANSISVRGARYQTYPGFRSGYRQFLES